MNRTFIYEFLKFGGVDEDRARQGASLLWKMFEDELKRSQNQNIENSEGKENIKIES